MKNIRRLALVTGVVACGGVLAQTETYNPSWYITPSLNTIKPDSRFGIDKSGAGVGLRLGKPLSESWDIQFGPTYARSRDSGRRYTQETLGADFLYLFSRDRFRPFLLLGLGAERDKTDGMLPDRRRSSPYIDGGLGFQYAFSDNWSTQVDWRRVHGYLRDNEFGFDRSNNNYLTVGLTYTFDRPPQEAPKTPEPAPAPAPPPEPPKSQPRFERYTLSATELFEFDSAELRQPQGKLDEIAKMLADNPKVDNVVVTGYTDRLGSKKYNLKLSQRRAEAVKMYLTGKGIEPNRISAVGKGMENPVVECKQKKRAALIKCLEPNRRVEIEQITIERRVE